LTDNTFKQAFEKLFHGVVKFEIKPIEQNRVTAKTLFLLTHVNITDKDKLMEKTTKTATILEFYLDYAVKKRKQSMVVKPFLESLLS
jgi:hypothetical protein